MECKNMPLVQVRNLTAMRGVFLLDTISVNIQENETFAVIGKTGAGKSMLLEAIAGFYKPDSGFVLYEGKNVTEIPIYKRNIGYLYQDYGLFPHLTAFSNIAYGLKRRKIPFVEINKSVRQIAELFEISAVLGQYPQTLSGGEQQRVALARALITHPPLLLLDEPFSALDRKTKQIMYEVMQKIHEDFKCSIVFVTHDITEAEQIADRIGVLIAGRLQGVVKSGGLYSYAWSGVAADFLGIENAGGKNDKKRIV